MCFEFKFSLNIEYGCIPSVAGQLLVSYWSVTGECKTIIADGLFLIRQRCSDVAEVAWLLSLIAAPGQLRRILGINDLISLVDSMNNLALLILLLALLKVPVAGNGHY